MLHLLVQATISVSFLLMQLSIFVTSQVETRVNVHVIFNDVSEIICKPWSNCLRAAIIWRQVDPMRRFVQSHHSPKLFTPTTCTRVLNIDKFREATIFTPIYTVFLHHVDKYNCSVFDLSSFVGGKYQQQMSQQSISHFKESGVRGSTSIILVDPKLFLACPLSEV